MTTTTDRRAPHTAAVPSVTITPVFDGDRPIGAWITGPDTAVYRPVVDLTRLTGALLAGIGAVAVATAVVTAASQRGRAIGAVTMGPGGWVSVKGTRPRSRGSRPLWARLLGAQPAEASRPHR
jgi:hypothetical protein